MKSPAVRVLRVGLRLVATLALGACYSPKLNSPGFYCHPSDNPACPDGQTCVGGRCVTGNQQVHVDGGLDFASGGDGGATVDLAGADFAGAHDLSHGNTGCVVRINEVQTAGGGGASDEFVELYNDCASATALAGYQLVYRSAAGTTDISFVTFAGQNIGANGFLVAGQTNYAGTADVRYSASGMAAAGGGLALYDGGGATVDSVGYGSATNAFVHGSAAPAPASAQSIGRKPDGHDSGNNASDFSTATPTPGAANQ